MQVVREDKAESDAAQVPLAERNTICKIEKVLIRDPCCAATTW